MKNPKGELPQYQRKKLLTYEVLPAKIITYSLQRLVATVVDLDKNEYYVHAPTSVSRNIAPEAEVLISPIDSPNTCSHRIVCVKVNGEWYGANPLVGEKAMILALKKGLVEGYEYLRYSKKREYDAICKTSRGEVSIEIKCVESFYQSWNQYIFPSKFQKIDSEMVQSNNYYKTPISERAVKQAKNLGIIKGQIFFVCIGPRKKFNEIFCPNLLDYKFYDACRKVKCSQIFLEWNDKGEIFYVGGPKKLNIPSIEEKRYQIIKNLQKI